MSNEACSSLPRPASGACVHQERPASWVGGLLGTPDPVLSSGSASDAVLPLDGQGTAFRSPCGAPGGSPSQGVLGIFLPHQEWFCTLLPSLCQRSQCVDYTMTISVLWLPGWCVLETPPGEWRWRGWRSGTSPVHCPQLTGAIPGPHQRPQLLSHGLVHVASCLWLQKPLLPFHLEAQETANLSAHTAPDMLYILVILNILLAF